MILPRPGTTRGRTSSPAAGTDPHTRRTAGVVRCSTTASGDQDALRTSTGVRRGLGERPDAGLPPLNVRVREAAVRRQHQRPRADRRPHDLHGEEPRRAVDAATPLTTGCPGLALQIRGEVGQRGGEPGGVVLRGDADRDVVGADLDPGRPARRRPPRSWSWCRRRRGRRRRSRRPARPATPGTMSTKRASTMSELGRGLPRPDEASS